ncbi:hypothetical protein GALMADRAFT_236456 [Galerina marginata CBS 339.88]|uniref:DUF4050 domain-containing protein n=1 Tax=Galerina marginata (strain CBS 339.88) TaxID=685588 RepID=A0A067TNT4_GALM3|nr:hypothetical protein GALMADRAFT_236456 [Galerina marginata CBS 339.88]
MTSDPLSTQPSLSFDEILHFSSLPRPGPEYYEARRRLWLTPRVTPRPSSPSSSRQKLEEIFSQPGAVHSQETWNHNLEKAWKGLSSGGKLNYNLPMVIAIKIIHAAWLRDRTWPVGLEAPVTDDEQQADIAVAPPLEASRAPEKALQATMTTTLVPSDLMEPVPPRMTINRT